LVQEELAYDQHSLTTNADNAEDMLNDAQRNAYKIILNVVTNKKGKLFIVYGNGGIGKTFVWTTLLSRLRRQAKSCLQLPHQELHLCYFWGAEPPIQDSRFQLICMMSRLATSHNI
jgi:primosomal protein N'